MDELYGSAQIYSVDAKASVEKKEIWETTMETKRRVAQIMLDEEKPSMSKEDKIIQ